jgi:phosphonoacetate hydrolase
MDEISFHSNGREFRVPAKPIVVVCIDGCGDDYLAHAMLRDCMPRLREMARTGFYGIVRGALPSFTNVNNASIVTGLPPSAHGICGNYFLDANLGEEVMMNSPKYLNSPTILSHASAAGRRVAMVTAKEKLRDILSVDLQGIAVSAEKANQARMETHGIDNVEQIVGHPTPPIYSADASLFVLRAGVALLEQGLSDFLYLSLTDYMQHRYAPWEAESLEFHAALDVEIGRLLDLGAILACTADHGMNAKADAAGRPNVIYLETELAERFGPGVRVICPITDPYVVHHGALGSAVTVYLSDASCIEEARRWLLGRPGVSEVYDRLSAGSCLELPVDRIGDLFVLSERNYVLGRTPKDHDLSALEGPLRSHGGRYEQMVPLVISRPLNRDYQIRAAGDPRNFEVFDFVCNGVTE